MPTPREQREKTLRDELMAAGLDAGDEWLTTRANRKMSEVNRRRLVGHIVNALWEPILDVALGIAHMVSEDVESAYERTLSELEQLRAELGTPADPDDVFLPGHTYRSENEYFEFACERQIGEYAIGIETLMKEWYLQPGMRFRKWATVGPSVGYHDVTGQEGGADD